MVPCCGPLAIDLTAAASAGRSKKPALAMRVVCWIAHDLKANRWVRVVTLIVAIPPNWTMIRRQALPVRSGGPPS